MNIQQCAINDTCKNIIDKICTNPSDTLLWKKLGYELRAQGEYDKSRFCFMNVLKINEKDAFSHREAARLSCLLGHYDQAVLHYELSRTIDPNDTQVLLEIAKCYELNRQPQKEIEYFEAYLALNRFRSDVRSTLADRLYQTEQYQKALECYSEVQSYLDYDDMGLTRMKGLCNYELGNYEKSKEYLEECLREYGLYFLIPYNESIFIQGKSEFIGNECYVKLLESYFKTALKLKDYNLVRMACAELNYATSNDETIRWIEIQKYFTNLEIEAIIEGCQCTEKYMPENGRMAKRLGVAYYLAKQYSLAKQTLEKYIDKNKQDALAFYCLAKCYKIEGSNREVLKIYARLKSMDNKINSEVFNNILEEI
ncbi:tetratricopeptide repeat protein [Solidesulfovibrio magneticus]|nr:tetratricopeptide repeat protein [Solidesulfovibrio magneticus]